MRPISHVVGHNRALVGRARALVGAHALVGQQGVPSQALAGTMDATYQQGGPLNGRRQNLGFPTTTALGAGLSTTVQSAPQVLFRPDRLFLSSGVAAALVINSILVGNKEQLLNGNPLPGSMFSELAVDSYVEYDTCEPAVSITLSITNTSAAAVTFTPGMTGRSAY